MTEIEWFPDPSDIKDAIQIAAEFMTDREEPIRFAAESILAVIRHADPIPFVPVDDQSAVTAVLAQHAHRNSGAVAAIVSTQETNAAILLS